MDGSCQKKRNPTRQVEMNTTYWNLTSEMMGGSNIFISNFIQLLIPNLLTVRIEVFFFFFLIIYYKVHVSETETGCVLACMGERTKRCKKREEKVKNVETYDRR